MLFAMFLWPSSRASLCWYAVRAAAEDNALAPFQVGARSRGHQSGQVLFDGVPLADVPEREHEVARIGFVMQDPDAQIVTDKVWLRAGLVLESLGCDRRAHALARGGDGQLLRYPALVP